VCVTSGSVTRFRLVEGQGNHDPSIEHTVHRRTVHHHHHPHPYPPSPRPHTALSSTSEGIQSATQRATLHTPKTHTHTPLLHRPQNLIAKRSTDRRLVYPLFHRPVRSLLSSPTTLFHLTHVDHLSDNHNETPSRTSTAPGVHDYLGITSHHPAPN
jgi:hypothetical protein